MKKKNFEYDVALSFAGEQRDYVEKVSEELTALKVKHFYDNNEKVNLWGKNLAQFLDSVYFEKAMYFVPFISKEYKKKIWTRLEVNSALERNMNESGRDFQQYIPCSLMILGFLVFQRLLVYLMLENIVRRRLHI